MLVPGDQQAARCGVTEYKVYLAVFLITTLTLFIKFYADKHLAADGAGYFYHILETRDFAHVAWSRRFAEYLSQWPLVLAVWFGLTDISTLKNFFAVGIYFPYLLSFSLCCYAVRDENKSLLWLPLAGYISFNSISDYNLIAEYHVMGLMTWPILLLLLKSRPLNWREGGVLCLLLILFTRMYEAAAVVGVVLFIAALLRIFLYRENCDRIISIVAMILLIVVISIATLYILNPRSIVNRGSFIESIWVTRRNWEVLATYGFLGMFSLGWLIPERMNLLRKSVFAVSLLPIIYYAFLRVTTDYAMTAYISFSSRSLSVVILPSLVLLGIILVSLKHRLNRTGLSIFVVSFIVMVGFNLFDLRNWIHVKQEFLIEINSDARYRSIDDTRLRNSHYRWSWNNSLLSLVWAEPCVRTIILNSPEGPQGPVDPRERVVLKRYLKYDSYFKVVDSELVECDS